jgi:hypothetical protein
VLNELKRKKVINDWVIYGAVAFIYWDEPVVTFDVDIFVTTAVEADYYSKVLSALGRYGPVVKEAATFSIGGVLVQVFPATGHELWEDLINHAVSAKVDGEPVRIASREHLIVLALQRFDPVKDVPRISRLYEKADHGKVDSLLKRFDKDGVLTAKLRRLFRFIKEVQEDYSTRAGS